MTRPGMVMHRGNPRSQGGQKKKIMSQSPAQTKDGPAHSPGHHELHNKTLYEEKGKNDREIGMEPVNTGFIKINKENIIN